MAVGPARTNKGNELCISPWLDRGPAELAGPALGSEWLRRDAAVMRQGALFAFSREHCLPSVRVFRGGCSWWWGCFPLSNGGMGTALLVLKGEEN